MNILEILKERKQVLKMSVVALAGTAAVYMGSAHMSSAMMNSGAGEAPVGSSQVAAKNKGDAEKVQPLSEDATKEKVELQTESKVEGAVTQDKQRATDVRLSGEVTNEDKSSLPVQEMHRIEFISDKEVRVDEKVLSCDEIGGNRWHLTFKNYSDAVETYDFTVSEGFVCKEFLNDIAKKLAETNDDFCVRDFVIENKSMNFCKFSMLRKYGELKCEKCSADEWSFMVFKSWFKKKCEIRANKDFDMKKFLSVVEAKLIKLGDAFSFDCVIGDSSVCDSISTQENSIFKKTTEVGLKILSSLPVKGQDDFEKFLELPDKAELSVEDQITYDEIKQLITDLTKNIDESDPHRQMKIAQAIYCWVANNIKYEEMQSRDAFFVFRNRKNICGGYSTLINLMMRVTGIPSLGVYTLSRGCVRHDYNAIYIDESMRRGWTLLDATWAKDYKRDYDEDLSECKNSFDKLLYLANSDENIVSVYYYHEAVNDMLTQIQNKGIVKDRIEEINNELSGMLAEINKQSQYKAINKIETIKIEKRSEKEAFCFILMPLSRSRLVLSIQDGAQKYLDEVNEKRRRSFFPACYDYDMSFQDANKKILSMYCHSIAHVSTSIYCVDTKEVVNALKGEKGEVYSLEGDEEDANIWLDGEVENFVIPRDILSFGLPIKIGSDVKSLILQGDEEIDISVAFQLENIDTTRSRRYIFEEGVLYERKDGKKGEIVSRVKHSVG